MVNPVSNNQTPSTGRSSEADQIYQKYLTYYNDINDVINAVNQIPSTSISSTQRADYINQLVALQEQLYPIYQNQYNNSSATLETFENACSDIGDQATQIYDDVTNTYSTSSSSSPINVFSNEVANSSGSSSTSSSGSSSTDSSSTSGTTTSTSSTTSSGRSPDADQIYSQYLSYYNDINSKINSINQLPYSTLNQSNVINDKKELAALQQQLYPIYVSQYGNSTATLSTFQDACADIETQVAQFYNDALGASQGETSNTGSSSGISGTTSSGSTTGSTGSTGTTGTTGVTPVTQQSSLANKVENGTWYVDWTSWNTPIPEGVNTVNLFVGNMSLDANGNPTIGGFGTLSQNPDQMDQFIQECHAKTLIAT